MVKIDINPDNTEKAIQSLTGGGGTANHACKDAASVCVGTINIVGSASNRDTIVFVDSTVTGSPSSS